MKPGALRDAIRIERGKVSLNDLGAPTITWCHLFYLRACRVQDEVREDIRGNGANDVETVVFRLRPVAGITNADRLIWNGRAFNIRQVVDLGHRIGIELRCVALNGVD